MRKRAPIGQVFLLFLRRLWLPAVLFVIFHLVVLTVYMGVEGVTWDDALFCQDPHACWSTTIRRGNAERRR